VNSASTIRHGTKAYDLGYDDGKNDGEKVHSVLHAAKPTREQAKYFPMVTF